MQNTQTADENDYLPVHIPLAEAAARVDFPVFQPVGLGDSWETEPMMVVTDAGPYVDLRGRRGDGASFDLMQFGPGGMKRMEALTRETFAHFEVEEEVPSLEELVQWPEADWGGTRVRFHGEPGIWLEAVFTRDGAELLLGTRSLQREELEGIVVSLEPVVSTIGLSQEERDDLVLQHFLGRQPSEDEYLREIERLAQEVVATASAARDGDYVFSLEGDKSELDLAITQLARSLRMKHWEGDGCVDDAHAPSDES